MVSGSVHVEKSSDIHLMVVFVVGLRNELNDV